MAGANRNVTVSNQTINLRITKWQLRLIYGGEQAQLRATTDAWLQSVKLALLFLPDDKSANLCQLNEIGSLNVCQIRKKSKYPVINQNVTIERRLDIALFIKILEDCYHR